MKIKNYKKDKNSLYEITFENNGKLKFHEDLILKYELLLKKEIKDSEIELIIKENEKYELYTKVLKYLATKMRCKKEIITKFKEYDKESIFYVINKLSEEGYLNDSDYIKAYINDQVNLRCIGPYKIKKDLIKLELNEEDINDYINTIDEDIWKEKIIKLIDKAIKSNHTKSNSMLAIKITNDLVNKGFYKEHISELLDINKFNSDSEILEKEVAKLYKKYSTKLDNYELKSLILNKLLSKGYNRDSIEKCFEKIN